MPARPWRAAPGGLVLTVRVTPKGGRDAVDGIADLGDGSRVLKVRVRAAASEGEANAAVIRLLAAVLGVPGNAVTLAAGGRGRVKRLEIAGEANALAAVLEQLCTG